MITMLYETGHPWITFKDPCNVRSPQDHVGVVHSSNLCTEITLNTSSDETAVCNLGSINLSRHIDDGKLAYERLKYTIKMAVRMLDNVVDLNFYPTEEARRANLRHRPIGLGVMGLQDALYLVNLPFGAEGAVEFSDHLQEFISYHAILSSSELAEEKGAYETYQGSKWDRGIFPVDTLDVLEAERGLSTGVDRRSWMDWKPVRERVKKHGLRNSNMMAIAPTATIANIAGCVPSIEPIYKNMYVKSNFSGEFTIINRFLVSDLKELGLWDEDMMERVKYYDGSVQRIEEIPAEVRAKYQEVFEIDPLWIVKHAAHRGKWIDQSQSVNVFTTSTSGKQISETYMAAWKMGLKTTYYLRTLGASGIEKSTLDSKAKKFAGAASISVPETVPATQVTKVCSIEDPTCEACQ
jgi:ribonucleoside-diphosphate reductase alpha chain